MRFPEWSGSGSAGAWSSDIMGVAGGLGGLACPFAACLGARGHLAATLLCYGGGPLVRGGGSAPQLYSSQEGFM